MVNWYYQMTPRSPRLALDFARRAAVLAWNA